ncbi:MAG: exonuclease SbcC [Tepidanaerobacteraceae bacterium]|nr:exonuclease SbcC [Tepidanaerobacteraceae bacterium]
MADKNDVAQKSKQDKTMSEISERLGTETVNQIQDIVNQQRRQNAVQYQNDQHKQFSTNIECLVNAAREQQMASEQQIQSTLNQASTSLMDARRLESLYNSAQQLQQGAQMGISNLQMNAKQYIKTIEQMEKDCHEQQVSTDMQAIQSMQQAVSALAQAQNAILQSQAINKMFDSITKCEDSLTQIEQMEQSAITM